MMRNAAFSIAAILVCVVVLGSSPMTATAASAVAGDVSPALGSYPLIGVDVAAPVAAIDRPVWSLAEAVEVLNAPEPVREYRIAMLAGTGLGSLAALGQGVLGAAPTLTFPAAPYNDGVEPNTGSADNPGTVAFTFRVDYQDSDGDAPDANQRDLEYDTDPAFGASTSVDMALVSGTADDGTYSVTVNLTAGATYYYRFNFDDTASEGPVLLNGPAPLVVNDIPNITGGANTAPNPTTPATGETAETTITCTYTDDDDDAPTISQVLVYDGDGAQITGSPFTMVVDTSAAAALHDGDYTNGEQYTATVDLPAGDSYTYAFNFSDGTATAIDAGAPYGPIVVGAAPLLTNESNTALDRFAHPELITQPTWVTFHITYTDANGDKPTTTELHIHKDDPSLGGGTAIPGSPFTMWTNEDPVDVTDGTVYTYGPIPLERPGVYYYYFSFTNTAAETVRSPEANYHGPIFITRDFDIYTLPSPYDDGCDPGDGHSNPTSVTFRLGYRDLDGEAPTVADVHIYDNADLAPGSEIAGSPFAMTKIEGEDSLGAVYSVTVDLPSPGHYFFYFWFDNGTYVPVSGPDIYKRMP
ncbi:MAG: hypothetical protein J7M38_15155, partial [Armatimonadetes bacterium]|nr:hypothetical protein [Armatimonadota bacterium]